MRLVAFTGKKGSGKSTAAQYLLGRGYEEIKFADPLKNMLRAMYATAGVTPEDVERRIEGDLKEAPDVWLGGKSPRYAMQTLGTEWRRMLYQDMWADMFYSRAVGGTFLVCSDYRFPEETPVLKELGCVIVRVTRGEAENSGDTHVSESHFDTLSFDYSIPNNGSKQDLYNKVEITLNHHFGDMYVQQ